jgi:hypothetical protein
MHGHTITSINVGDVRITFGMSDGRTIEMYHDQDCCEAVYVEDVIGDIHDLVGTPLLRAEERTEDEPADEYGDIGMWTFYEFATIKGSGRSAGMAPQTATTVSMCRSVKSCKGNSCLILLLLRGKIFIYSIGMTLHHAPRCVLTHQHSRRSR